MSKILISIFTLSLTVSGTAFASDPPGESDRLAEVLAAQSGEMQSRYPFRHPLETLEFFEVSPGTTVMEALPGGGWYSRLLLSYLGQGGQLIGADYALEMYPKFGFFSEEQLEAKKTWMEDWMAEGAGWAVADSAGMSAFVFGSMPEQLRGQADVVLIIRALHNLARFESDGGYLTTALDDAFNVLKPGGIAGVVQHQARDDMPDEWAGGRNGYLKKAFVIARMEEAGFEFLGASDINVNGKDQPTEKDIVWRLPPSFATSRDDPELQAEMQAIGESSRMTLKFRKPG